MDMTHHRRFGMLKNAHCSMNMETEFISKIFATLHWQWLKILWDEKKPQPNKCKIEMIHIEIFILTVNSYL